MKYLCGCDVESKTYYRVEYDANGSLVIPSRNGVRICPEHGVEIEGYRTDVALRAGQLSKAGGV